MAQKISNRKPLWNKDLGRMRPGRARRNPFHSNNLQLFYLFWKTCAELVMIGVDKCRYI